MARLTGKNVVVGISGGIAAYKMCEVVSSLTKLGATVTVIMTRNATEFVQPLTFETLSHNRVILDTFDRDFDFKVEHVFLAKSADLFLIAPATGDIIGKIASGIADDMLTTTIMATHSPVIVAPAMNTGMYTSSSVQANLSILRDRGYIVLDAPEGVLACGDVGAGRLPEPSYLVDKVVEMLSPTQDYLGRKVLVSAGATREPIDPVRFITNRSSGKMGKCVAERVIARGGIVRIVEGITSVEMPECDKCTKVSTTLEMRDAMVENMKWADIIIMSAAPADYRVKDTSEHKIKSETLTLELVKNPDIAQELGSIKRNNQTLVIFAAETEDLLTNATAKLNKKNADFVVANDVMQSGAGFDVDTNSVTIISKDGAITPSGLLPKSEVADIILDEIINDR